MSIRVRVPTAGRERIGFVCSPALEAILSLSVLVQPNHHPLHHDWVRATRKRLPGEMKQRLADFRFRHMDYIPAGLVPDPSPEPLDFAADLARIRALPPEEQSASILRNLTGAPPEAWDDVDGVRSPEMLLERATDLGSATVELVTLGLEHPDVLVDRFLAFLDLYWRLIFEEVWEESRPRLEETVAQAQRRVEAGGLISMLETLRPRIGVDRRTGEFWIRREHEELIEVAADGQILFVPSAFLWPHIGLVRDRSRRLAVLYPAPFAAFEAPPMLGVDAGEGVVPLLRALADTTRMQALKLMAERPRSTQELAMLIGIGESAMSKHLRQLAEAGVVRTRRDGYYVLYSVSRERIEPLSALLLEFLEPD